VQIIFISVICVLFIFIEIKTNPEHSFNIKSYFLGYLNVINTPLLNGLFLFFYFATVTSLKRIEAGKHISRDQGKLMSLKRKIVQNFGPGKVDSSAIIEFAFRWFILGTIMYGILPDSAKRQQGYGTSILLAFLVTVALSLSGFQDKVSDNIKAAMKSNHPNAAPKVKRYIKRLESPPYVIASFVNIWILMGLIEYSFSTDTQKTSAGHVWLCILFGFLIALGFAGGKLLLLRKRGK
jgi:hypothetical protein